MQGNLKGVRSQLAEAVRIADEEHLKEYGHGAIETSAILRFALGEHLQGARLFGAAETELRRMGYQPTSPDEKFATQWTAIMREDLGEENFSTALTEGSKLSYQEALAQTRTWLENGLE